MNNQNQFHTITLTGLIQLLSKCSVFPFSGGKRAPTEESNKMCRCTIPNCMKLGLSEHLSKKHDLTCLVKQPWAMFIFSPNFGYDTSFPILKSLLPVKISSTYRK